MGKAGRCRLRSARLEVKYSVRYFCIKWGMDGAALARLRGGLGVPLRSARKNARE
jgi:hypothetical protein